MILRIVAALAAFAGLYLLAPVIVQRTTFVATGTITATHEAIVMQSGDRWRRVFEVTYRYTPADEPNSQIASHAVDAETFERLRVGSPVAIRYSQWKPVRPVVAYGSFVDGTTLTSRLGNGSFGREDWLLLVGIVSAALAGWAAYRRRSAALAIVAVLLAGVAYPPAMLLAGAVFVFPRLFWSARRQPVHGLLLVAAIAATAAIAYWRVPRPLILPDGNLRETTAMVRRVKTVDKIWVSGGSGSSPWGGQAGFSIHTPFDIVDLELTPPGANDAMHAVDMIDTDSGRTLRQGEEVRVRYPVHDPRSAQLVEATRTYGDSILTEVMVLTFGGAALVTFVGFPLAWTTRRAFGRLTNRGSSIQAGRP